MTAPTIFATQEGKAVMYVTKQQIKDRFEQTGFTFSLERIASAMRAGQFRLSGRKLVVHTNRLDDIFDLLSLPGGVPCENPNPTQLALFVLHVDLERYAV